MDDKWLIKERRSMQRHHALDTKPLTSHKLHRDMFPFREDCKVQPSSSPSISTSDSLKKNWYLLMRAMERDSKSCQVDDNTDARMLFNAVRKGKLRLAKFILDATPVEVVNATDMKGKTSLIIACSIKEELPRDLMVNLLIRHDADVNALDDDGRSALSHACEKRCNDIVDILVKQGNVDPDIPDVLGNTALIYCSKVGNDVAIDILIRHFRRLGLDVDHMNKEGFTALLLAAKQGNITCAKILIQQGRASLLHRDKVEGFSAQEWLLHNGFTWEDIVSLISRMRSRARFVKAINIARVSAFQKGKSLSQTNLKLTTSNKVSLGKSLYLEDRPVTGHRSMTSKIVGHSGTESDSDFTKLVANGYSVKQKSISCNAKLPKIKLPTPKEDIEGSSPEYSSSSEDEKEQTSNKKSTNRRDYRPHFRKTCSQELQYSS